MKTVEKLLNWWRRLPPHLDRISPFSLICGDMVGPYGHTTARRVIESQAKHLSISVGDTILDLASGFGGPARFLAHQYGCKVHCVDLDEDKVEIAIALNKLENIDHLITTSCGDAGDLKIEADSIDLVWGHSWGLKETYEQLLAETYRVLAPGGTFINYCRSSYLPLFSQCGFATFTAHTYFHELLKEALSEYIVYLENIRTFIGIEFGEKTLSFWDLEIDRKIKVSENYNHDWVLVEARN